MPINLRSKITFFLGWPLSVVALIFLTRSFLSKSGGIELKFENINLFFVLLGILFFISYYFLRSLTWYSLLRFKGYELNLGDSLFSWSFAQLKRYVPGNIWGIVGVSLHFSQKKVSKKDLSSAFMTESILVLLTASSLSLLAASLVIKSINLAAFEYLIRNFGFALLAVVTFTYLFSEYICTHLKLPKFFAFLLPSLSFTKLSKVWALMFLSITCYGIGTYFISSSLAYMNPLFFWIFVGYFSFSLLLGFVSFITPTGLGVREGAIAFGLGSVMSSGVASFIALFARFIMILSELLFLFIAYICQKTQNKLVKKPLRWIKNNPQQIILFLAYLGFCLYFYTISALRFENFYAGRFDLGNMDQTVWNTLQGNIFQFTNPNGTNVVSRLAFHADFILVLLAPIYALWQDPRMLLLIQAIVVGAGAFFIYLLSRFVLKDKNISLAFSILYLLNPSLERAVIYDFHAVTMATTFLIASFYFLLKKNYWWFGIFAVLAGLTKEQIWSVIALFGIYIFLIQKRKTLGAVVVVVSSFLFYFLIWKLIPAFSGGAHFALSYYSTEAGINGPTALIEKFAFSPLSTLKTVLTPEKLDYLNALFAPLGYLSFISPFYLAFALPGFAINLLSAKAELYQIYYQYTSAITPFIFISGIFGVAFILKRVHLLTPFVLGSYLILSGLWTAYRYGPLPGAKSPNLDMVTKVFTDKTDIDSILAQIPANYSVSTSNSLGSHLSHRKYLFTIPYGWDTADYVIFLKKETNAYPSIGDHLKQIERLSASHAYIKYFDDGNLVAFRKKGIPILPE